VLVNLALTSLEAAVVALGLALLLAELGLPAARRRALAYVTAAVLALLFLNTFSGFCSCAGVGQSAFAGMFVQDGLSVFAKRLFLLAGLFTVLMAAEAPERLGSGLLTYCALVVFALAGMLFAASANDLVMLFVTVELLTLASCVLVSFQRGQTASLEAGLKYLILGAVASAFLVFGIALVWGVSGRLNFSGLAELLFKDSALADNKLFLTGVLLILAGLSFKLATFPMPFWAPDVYEGAPTPTAAFLAIGSKAAGFVLLLRFLFTAVSGVAAQWAHLLVLTAGATILYGNLCALPQRNLKRLLGYSSIAHAGYLLLGVAALSDAGRSALLFYLVGYLFTTAAAFAVVVLVLRQLDAEDITNLAGLGQRAPLVAVTMTLAMASLAGVPPLVGFFGKFLLLKAVIERGTTDSAYYALAFAALAGVVISLYYYFGVIRAIYWSQPRDTCEPVSLSASMRLAIAACIGGMLWLGLFPGTVLGWAENAAAVLK